MSLLEKISSWARRIKRDAVTLWFAYKHSETPLMAKALCVLVVAYALSPIDLIPDFVPVFGYLDDAILLPVLIWLAIRIVPINVLSECRIKAAEWLAVKGGKPRNNWGILFVGAVWMAAAWVLWRYLISPSV